MTRRVLAALALAALGAVLAAPAAGAHALLLSSEPGDGESLAAAPQRIVLRFTERPDLALSSIRVNAGGSAVAIDPLRALPGNAVEVRPRARLAEGAYTVEWRVVSTADGHLTAGALGFGIGQAAPPVQTETRVDIGTRSPSAVSVTGRWLLYAGMALLLGAAAGGLFVHGRALPSWRWALPASWGSACAGLAMQIAGELGRSDAGLSSFLGSGRGTSLVRVGAVLAGTGIVVFLTALRPGRALFVLLGVGSAGAMLAQAAAGHAAAGSRVAATVGVQWIHLLGTGVWIGGLPWLLLALRREPDRAAVGRFARLAGGAIAVVAATGAARAIAEVGSPGRLSSTSFGRVVLIKVALFAPLVVMGAINHYRLVPRLRREGKSSMLRRLVTAEIVIAVAMLAAAGTMAELPPSAQVVAAAEAAERAKPKPVVVEGADFATTVRLRLSISPGTPGPNALEARILDYDSRRALTDVRAVGLKVRRAAQAAAAATSVALTRAGEVWTGRTGALALPGEWIVEALVERQSGSATVELRPQIRTPAARITVSASAGQPTLYTADFAGVGSVQVYADPGKAGANQVHATFFNTAGKELSIERIALTLGEQKEASVNRFSEGHFVADATLSAGRLRVAIDATTRDAVQLKVAFNLDIQS